MGYGSKLAALGAAALTLLSGQAQAQSLFDRDGDSWNRFLDCNDRDATVYPGAPELDDNKDNDCDLLVDEGIPIDVTLSITSPGDGQLVPVNGVVLQAVVTDELAADEMTYELSSTAGSVELVSVRTVAGDDTVEVTANLPCGVQVLSLTATTPDGLESSTDEVEVEADDPPVAAITSPTDADIYGEGFVVDLQGISNDVCQDPGQLEVTWVDNGQLVFSGFADPDGTTSTVLSNLEPGDHTLVLGVQDPNGLFDSDTVTITILDGELCSATDDMVLNWEFEEGAGITLLDTSGAGNFGEIFGEPTWVDSVSPAMGQALSLDGINDFAVANSSDSLDATDEVTVMMWVRPGGFPPVGGGNPKNWFPLLSKGEADDFNTERNYSMYVTSTQAAHFSLSLPSGTGTTNPTESSAGFSAGTWTHVAGRATVNSSGTVTYFLDGSRDRVFTGRGNTALLANDQPLYLGQTLEANPNFFGAIDDVRVYPCALSDAQIQAIYDATAP